MTDTITRTDRIVWRCDACKRPIADGKGAVFFRSSDLLAYRKDQAAMTRERDDFFAENPEGMYLENMTALMEAASVAPWLAMHHKCDQTPDDCYYSFDVARIRTTLDVLSWTRHLLEKSWLTETAWDDLIGEVLRSRLDTTGLLCER